MTARLVPGAKAYCSHPGAGAGVYHFEPALPSKAWPAPSGAEIALAVPPVAQLRAGEKTAWNTDMRVALTKLVPGGSPTA